MYIIEREVLDSLPPAGTKLSIERDVFPELVDNGLYGYESLGYWLDIGTPERYLQATFDILDGEVRPRSAGGWHGPAVRSRRAMAGGIDGSVHAPAMIGPDCRVARGATVGRRTVLGAGVRIESGAHVERSVLLEGCRVGAGSRVSTAILGPGVTIGDDCRIDHDVVLGESVKIGAGNILTAGMRIFPGVELPERAVSVLSVARSGRRAGDCPS